MERRGMDLYLRRLKQELVSMKEVGDGLHEQMNSMMGALQELKLLQVQTALEKLEISGGLNQSSNVSHHRQYCRDGRELSTTRNDPRPPREEASVAEMHLEERSSFSSRRSVNAPSPVSSLGSGQMELPFRTMYGVRDFSETGSTSSTLATVECWSPGSCQSTSSPFESLPHTGTPHSCTVFSSHDQGCQDCSNSDDTGDWTSSLMSQSRNRQPLVLGDNIFADLVGNWLDLPEVDKKGEITGEPYLSTSRSQEVCKKFSLTANIFKKFLRSVMPDKSKLLKEKPGWLPVDAKKTEISKRSKKDNKQKGTFYFSFHNNMQHIQSRSEKVAHKEESKEKPNGFTKRAQNPVDLTQSGFDFNTAVWV